MNQFLVDPKDTEVMETNQVDTQIGSFCREYMFQLPPANVDHFLKRPPSPE